VLRLKSDQPALMQAIGAEFDGDEADNDTSRKLRSSTTLGKGSITPRNTDHHGGPPLRQSSNGSGQALKRRRTWGHSILQSGEVERFRVIEIFCMSGRTMPTGSYPRVGKRALQQDRVPPDACETTAELSGNLMMSTACGRCAFGAVRS